MVFGAYRKDDFADPESFRVQLAMVLERHSDDVIRYVTEPTTGLQSTCKFPPSIAEATEFCVEANRRATYADSWDQRSTEQLKEREKIENELKQETPECRKAVVDRFRNEMRALGIVFPGDRQNYHGETPVTAKAKYGLTDEQWGAIPDASPQDDTRF